MLLLPAVCILALSRSLFLLQFLGHRSVPCNSTLLQQRKNLVICVDRCMSPAHLRSHQISLVRHELFLTDKRQLTYQQVVHAGTRAAIPD